MKNENVNMHRKREILKNNPRVLSFSLNIFFLLGRFYHFIILEKVSPTNTKLQLNKKKCTTVCHDTYIFLRFKQNIYINN